MDNPQSDLGQMVVLPLCDLEQVTAPSVPLICRVSLITSFSQDSEENLVGPLVGPALQLSYSSVLFGKQRIVHPQGMRVGQPQNKGSSILAPLLICFFSSP